MTKVDRKNQLSGAADAICRSRFSPYLFSFLFSAVGLGLVFLLARDALSFLYETQAAGWYGLLRSLGRENALALTSDANDLALLSFSFNPVNRLLSFFPFSSTLVGACLFNAIRCGLAGAAFCYFLKLRESDDLSAVLFSILYALSSYSLVASLTGVAADGLIVLPLLLSGIERIVARRGFALFSVALAVSAVVSFRTTFGFFVFSFLWLFAVRFTRSGVKVKTLLFDLLLVVLAIPAAILLSAPVFFPAFDRLLLSFLDLRFAQSYNLIEFFGKMLPATYDGLFGNRFPYLFIGMIPLLLLPLFFLCKRIAVREKIVFGVLLFVLYFTFSVNVLSAFWDLFAEPDGYSYVVAAVFPALFLAVSARAYAKADRSSERVLSSVALILVALISILQRMNLSYETEEGTKVVWFSEINSVWVPLPFLILGCAGLLAVIRLREKETDKRRGLKSALSLLLILVTLFDVSVSGAAFVGVIAKKEGTDVSPSEGKHDYTSAYFAAYAAGISECGISDGLYRAEKFDAKTANDASYLGYHSAAALDPEVLSAFGIEYDENGALKTVSSPLSLSLFGVRYVMTHEKIETKVKEKKRLKQTTAQTTPTYDTPGVLPASLETLFEPIYRDDAGTVYENPTALPLVFRAEAIPDESVLNRVNATPYSRVNEVFCVLTGDRDEATLAYIPSEIASVSNPYCSPIDSDHAGYAAYTRTSANGAAAIQYTVTIGRDGPLFCCFPSEYPLTSADIKVNGRSIGHAYLETETEEFDENGEKIVRITPNALFVGNFAQGDAVTVSFSFGSGVEGTVCYLPENVPFFYEIDRTALDLIVGQLTDASREIRVKDGAVEAKASTLSSPAVVSTIPSSVVNVQGDEPSSFLGRFAAGYDEGTLTLSPALGGTGVYLLSLIGVLLLGLLLFCETLADKGYRIPFFFRAAGGKTEDGRK